MMNIRKNQKMHNKHCRKEKVHENPFHSVLDTCLNDLKKERSY